MDEQYSRTAMLLGEDGIEKLRNARVAVFGVGGVGGYVVEALARCGIGAIDVIDDDKVSLSNLNRQILATRATVGRDKVDVAEERIQSIDPTIRVVKHKTFYLPETADQFDFKEYDYIVDAIDTVTGKLALIQQAKNAGTPIISCMGTGNKMDPSAFQVAELSKTSGCALARIMRKECHKRGLDHVKVVYSKELPMTPSGQDIQPCDITDRPGTPGRRALPGSVSFVPAAAGMIAAGEVIRELTGVIGNQCN